MKRLLACSIAAATSLAAAPAVLAQSHDMGGMDTKGMDRQFGKTPAARTHKGSGTVTKVDPGRSSVTIAHGPVQTMNWPAMTMTFGAADKKLLERVRPGAKVDFEFVQQGSRYTITSVK